MFSWVRVFNGAGASWVVWEIKQLQALACSRSSALCILYCVKAKEARSFDTADQQQVWVRLSQNCFVDL